MKIHKFLIPIMSISALGCIAPVFTSCGQNGWDVHFEKLEESERHVKAGNAASSVIFKIKLANVLENNQKLYVGLNSLSKSSETLKVSVDQDVTIAADNKTVSVNVKIDREESNSDPDWVSFNLKFACWNNDGNRPAWTAQLNDFKIEFSEESHLINCSSKVEGLAIAKSSPSMRLDEQFTITIDNSRSIPINDASLTIKVGTNKVLKNIALTFGQTTQIVKTYSKSIINQMLTDAGLEQIAEGDSIDFYVVRNGSYKVVDNNRLQQSDEFGQYSNVDDSIFEGETLNGKFLLKNSLGEFETKEDFKDFVQHAEPDSEVELHLLKGQYDVVFDNPASGLDLTLVGVSNSANNKMATFKFYYTYDDPAAGNPPGVSTAFTLKNLKVLTRDGKQSGNYYANGVQCPGLNCYNCDFTGAFSLFTDGAYFYKCNFDSTKCYYSDDNWVTIKSREAVFVYSEHKVTFDGCKFKNGGKAIKLYPANIDATIDKDVIKDCEFELDQSYFNEKVRQEGFPNVPSIKYPVEINSTQMLNNNKIYIEITNSYANDAYKAVSYQQMWCDEDVLDPKLRPNLVMDWDGKMYKQE